MKGNFKNRFLYFLSGMGVAVKGRGKSVDSEIFIQLEEFDTPEISGLTHPDEMKALYKKGNTRFRHHKRDFSERLGYVYFAISMALSVIYILSTIGGVRPVHYTGVEDLLTPELFFYPLTFILVNMMSELYGIKLAQISIATSVVANLLFAGGFWLTTRVPNHEEWFHDQAYQYVLSNINTVLFPSLLAYVISANINVWLLCEMKCLLKTDSLYIRVIVSSAFSAAIDSVIFYGAVFSGVISPVTIRSMMLTSFVVKLLYAVVGVLPLYGARKSLNDYRSM